MKCFAFLFMIMFVFGSNTSTIVMPLHRVDLPVKSMRVLGDLLEEVPLMGNFQKIGYYYTTIYIGTPPQKFTVIVDTGSSIMSVPCTGCDCGKHLNSPFVPSSSSSSEKISCANTHGVSCSTCNNGGCSWSQSYTEGSSYRGIYYYDYIYLGGDTEIKGITPDKSSDHIKEFAIQYPFGCHSKETKLFRTQEADGILGLSPRSNTFLLHLKNHNKLPNPVFSLCIAETGGYFAVGGIETSFHKGTIGYTPYSGDSYYYADGSGISVGGRSVSGTFSHVLVDSGTSLTYMSSSMINSISSSLYSYCNSKKCVGTQTTGSKNREHFCFKNPDLSSFPDITITFSGGAVLVVKAKNYMWRPNDRDTQTYCLGLYSMSRNILGNNFMRDHDFIFNLNKHNIGIVEANCNGKPSPKNRIIEGNANITVAPSAAAVASPTTPEPTTIPPTTTKSNSQNLKPANVQPEEGGLTSNPLFWPIVLTVGLVSSIIGVGYYRRSRSRLYTPLTSGQI